MTPERLAQIRQLFEEALNLPASERAAFLARRCESDPDLLAEVESLLEDSNDKSSAIAGLHIRSSLQATATAESDPIGAGPSDAAVPTSPLKGRYLLQCQLGRGGFGVVYLATDQQLLSKRVVVKIMLNAAPDRWERRKFRNEIEALVRLSHPGIVSILDTGETPDNRPFLVMEYIEGVSLRSLIRPEGMDFERVADIARQVGSALDSAHRNGIWHRDLKPENIMIQTLDDGEQRIKLIDFGIATVQGSEAVIDSTTRVAGTFRYMAPEQLRGRPSAASDLYTLGVIVYEMLTGRRPFNAETAPDLYLLQKAGVEVRPSSLRPAISERVEWCVLKALQFAEADRQESVAGFAQELLEALRIRQSPARSEAGEAEPHFGRLVSKMCDRRVQEDDFKGFPARSALRHDLHGEVGTNLKPPISLDRRNRIAILKRVRADWIDGVLNQSLYKVARLELRLETREDAVESLLNAIVQVPDRAPFVIPPGADIAEVFDSLGQALLILGAPGTGKTTLLLELADALLDRALQDETHPIPAVFNLSTWALKREQLASWMVSELNQRSGVPKKLAQRWVAGGEVLPLLDGLDEVDAAHRPACLDAINQFRSEHGLLPIAVCSRIADFDALGMTLRLHSAVVVQPLTRSQVDDYLARGTELQSLRAAAKEDSLLEGLLETPLMLWVAMLAYRDIPVETVKEEGLEQRRRRLFASFVYAMFKRRAVECPYDNESTLHWLSSSASMLSKNKQTVFYLENLQPNWLPTRKQRWLSKAGTVVGCGVVCGLIGILGIGMALLAELPNTNFKLTLGAGLRFGLRVGLMFGLMFGLIVGLSLCITEPKPTHIPQFSFVDIRSRLRRATRSALIVWMSFGLFTGLMFALTGGRISFGGRDLDLGVGVVMSVLGVGLIPGLIVGLVTLLTTGKVESRVTPNQGTRDSLKSAFVMLLILGLIVMLLSLFGVLSDGPEATAAFSILLLRRLALGLFSASTLAPFAWLFGGGIFAIRHFVLRFVLWRSGASPFNYVAFLNYVSERLFVRKVGGGYIFIHRMLLEYFVSLGASKEAPDVPNVKAATS